MTRVAQNLTADIEAKWQALQQAAAGCGVRLPADAANETEIRRVLGFSEFVSRHAVQNPHWVATLLKRGRLNAPYDRLAYQRRWDAAFAGDPEAVFAQLPTTLRRFRREEMLRIAWRDLSGRAPLEAILSELSDLADVCIDNTLHLLHEDFSRQYGRPTAPDGRPLKMVVVGMGKLGARELNFSSDVDLILAFAQAGRTTGTEDQAAISNDDFFTRLARRLIQTLSQVLPEGFVFRVDTGLRPFGESGPLVMSFNALENYYQSQGREWERYAWIKARIVAGDRADGKALLALLQPFVYRRYLDFGVFDSLREMKNKIALEVRRQGMARDIKLGAGGIREIEFFGQFFQLIRGGVVPALQERRIMRVLALLAREGYIQAETRDRLTEAYIFLRRTEHRLQALADQQTHRLPSEPRELERLAWAMDFETRHAFEEALGAHRDFVHQQFSTLLENEGRQTTAVDNQVDLKPFAGVWQEALDKTQAETFLAKIGFEIPSEILARLEDLRRQAHRTKISPEGFHRLDRLVPQLLQASAAAAQPDQTFKRIADILISIGRRATYLALLAENPPVLQHLIRLAGASHFIAALIARRPVLLDELLDPRTLYAPPGRNELKVDLRALVAKTPPDDLEFLIESICIFRQVNTLRVAAADVTGALPLMRVSDHLSELAEVILQEVVELAWKHLVKRHGSPAGSQEASSRATGFGVVAYGKLGGLELGYGSDLDLVFLHSAEKGFTQGRDHPIDNGQFFARLGQRVIHILTAHTRAGRIYETDMRLRPSGSSGPLVSHLEAYAKYLRDEAWTWEQQALIRARVVCGHETIRRRFDQIRREVLAQPRDRRQLRQEIVEMREKLRRQQGVAQADVFDLKQGRGGIVDIEFLVQYLILARSHQFPALTEWTDNVRLLVSLIDSGLLNAETAYFLREAYLILRAASHRLSLQNLPAKVSRERFLKPRRRVERYWRHFMQT